MAGGGLNPSGPALIRWDKEAGIVHVGGESDFLQDSLACLPPTELCVCQGPAAVPAHPRLGGHCWDTPGLLLLPRGLGGAGGVKEEPLIWGLPTLAGMRADLSSGLGSVPHQYYYPGGESRPSIGGVTKLKLWRESSTTVRLAGLRTGLPLKPLWESPRGRG